jgi:hypothetical protein
MKLVVLAHDLLDRHNLLLQDAIHRCLDTHLAKWAVIRGAREHGKFLHAYTELHPRIPGVRHCTLVPVVVLLFLNSDSLREDEEDDREGQKVHRADSEGSCVQAN